MSTPEVIVCRECHREDHHQLSCSHVRYESRTVVQPEDEVAASHEPEQPYCPGPEVECHFGDSGVPSLCSYSDGPCYYGTETVEEWEARHEGRRASEVAAEFRRCH